MSLEFFKKQGKASFVLGGQWGSEGKGSACAYVATHLGSRNEAFDIVTANNGAQSGHVSIHGSVSKIQFHLPTASVWPQNGVQPLTYLNGGAIIDPELLLREIDENAGIELSLAIHPNAAIITQDCKNAEMRDDSAQTRIASTRKGVGEALSRKILRSGKTARDEPRLAEWVRRVDLNDAMMRGSSVLVEIPQGHSLSIDTPFYPHATSRNCTVGQAMADAGIHPHFYHASMLVIRTFPIRVGNIIDTSSDAIPGSRLKGWSGDCFSDQHEISWADLGVQAEITTVTKRQRRVFTFSEQQVAEAIASTRPAVIYLTFCDYVPHRNHDPIVRVMVDKLREMCKRIGSIRHDGPEILTQWGPSTDDVIRGEDV